MKHWFLPKTLGTKLLLVVSIPLVAQFVTAGMMGWLGNHLISILQYEFESKELVARVNWLNFEISNLSLFFAAKNMTDVPAYAKQYDVEKKKIAQTLQELEQVVKRQSGFSADLLKLTVVINEYCEALNAYDKAAGLDARGKVEAFLGSGAFRTIWIEYPKLRGHLLESHRQSTLRPVSLPFLSVVSGAPLTLPDLNRALSAYLYIVGGFTIVLSAFTISLAFGLKRRLALLADNAWRLASKKPLREPIGGFDEVAALDKTFHEMAFALNEAAEKEHALTKHALDLICSIDHEQRFTVVNPACLSVLGYTEDELIGRRVLSIVDHDDIERTSNFLTKIRSAQQEPDFENRMRRKNGEAVDVLWSVNYSKSSQSIFCVLHDITERKKSERLRREVVNMVTHDIRTPLTTMQVGLETLSRITDADKRERSIERMLRACNTVLALTSDYLDIEKAESGRLELSLSDVRVSDVFAQAIDSTSGMAQAAGIKFESAAQDLVCHADASRLAQVVTNLLSNAVKFSPRGGTIYLRARLDETNVEIAVEDEGRGVPKHLQEAIFERYRQVEIEDSTTKKGSGLGLAICKAIVELHGGKIWCQTRDEGGSRFCFTIPRAAS